MSFPCPGAPVMCYTHFLSRLRRLNFFRGFLGKKEEIGLRGKIKEERREEDLMGEIYYKRSEREKWLLLRPRFKETFLLLLAVIRTKYASINQVEQSAIQEKRTGVVSLHNNFRERKGSKI